MSTFFLQLKGDYHRAQGSSKITFMFINGMVTLTLKSIIMATRSSEKDDDLNFFLKLTEKQLMAIEKASGQSIPRVSNTGNDYIPPKIHLPPRLEIDIIPHFSLV